MTVTDDSEAADGAGFAPGTTDAPANGAPAVRPSIALAEAVAAAKGVDPVALDPIGDQVDLDALDALLTSALGEAHTSVTVEFQGVRARVERGGTVTVRQSGSDAQGTDQ